MYGIGDIKRIIVCRPDNKTLFEVLVIILNSMGPTNECGARYEISPLGTDSHCFWVDHKELS